MIIFEEPADVITGNNGKEESVLNIETTDNTVASKTLTASKNLNPNQINVGNICIVDFAKF